MVTFAHPLEPIVRPFLEPLAGTGLLEAMRFAPLYCVGAALAAVVLTSYVVSLLVAPSGARLVRLRRVRLTGRATAVVMAGVLTHAVMSDARFVLTRGGAGALAVSLDVGFVLVLGPARFLELRLAQMRGRSQ